MGPSTWSTPITMIKKVCRDSNTVQCYILICNYCCIPVLCVFIALVNVYCVYCTVQNYIWIFISTNKYLPKSHIHYRCIRAGVVNIYSIVTGKLLTTHKEHIVIWMRSSWSVTQHFNNWTLLVKCMATTYALYSGYVSGPPPTSLWKIPLQWPHSSTCTYQVVVLYND